MTRLRAAVGANTHPAAGDAVNCLWRTIWGECRSKLPVPGVLDSDIYAHPVYLAALVEAGFAPEDQRALVHDADARFHIASRVFINSPRRNL